MNEIAREMEEERTSILSEVSSEIVVMVARLRHTVTTPR